MCTPNQTAKTVAKILVEKWFHVYGIPTRIHSDQGRYFDFNIIKALCKMYGIEQSFTSPYNPRGNAFCKRFNRTLFGLLKILKSEEKADWPSYLPLWFSLTMLHLTLLPVINHTNLCLVVVLRHLVIIGWDYVHTTTISQSLV